MTVLVVGASGATGRHVVSHLAGRGNSIRVIVRNPETFREQCRNNPLVSIIHAGILDMSAQELAECTKNIDAVVSCLGHTISLKGLFGKPHLLVTDAVKRLCAAVEGHKPQKPVRFVLMSTTANRNNDLQEKRSFAEKCVFFLLRALLPPQRDNENAAEYLRSDIGKENPFIEWAAVRPDTLINETEVSDYEIHNSPVRSPVFNAGQTSRINTGHFIAALMTDEALWNAWKGKMPVIYNKS
jgi:nucleoside-diphosphate-sugar epimerase